MNIFEFNQDNLRAADSTRSTGDAGERLAARFLTANGYRLVVSNFTVPVGRNSRGAQVTGEIDLIAMDGDILCFIEVKTRRSADFAAPTANVDIRKQRQITRAAKVYRKIFGIRDIRHRFDVVSVVLPENGRIEVELFKGYWNESKFRKKIWHDGAFV